MFLSRIIRKSYIYLKFILSLFKLPYYVFINRSFISTRYYSFLATMINLEKDYQSHVKLIDMKGLQELLNGDDPYIHFKFGSRFGNVNLLESIALAYIVQTMNPKRIFEFGTFDGFSTYHLAMNSSENAVIYTLDLADSNLHNSEYFRSSSIIEHHADLATYDEMLRRGVGVEYKVSSSGYKVKQLVGDSLRSDFSEFKGNIDLCFIDGGHSLECIRSDTANALDMIVDGGIIIWHDFNIQHRDIYSFLIGFSQNHKLWHLKDTRLAFYVHNQLS